MEALGGGAADARTEELSRLGSAQRIEAHPLEPSRAVLALQGHREARRGLVRAECEGDQDRTRRRPSQQAAEQFDRGGVGPVGVVERQHQWPARRQRLQQAPHRVMGAVALVAEDGGPAGRGGRQGGEHVRQLCAVLVVEGCEQARVEPVDVLVERVHEDPEGQVTLELAPAAREGQQAPGVRAEGELGQEPRLADARLAGDRDDRRPPGLDIREEPLQARNLRGAAHEPLLDHGQSGPPDRAYVRCAGSESGGAGSGCRRMPGRPARNEGGHVPSYLLQHRHESRDCGVVFAAFRGYESPLRHRPALASCASGGHAIWWTVEAAGEELALGVLPPFVAARTTATEVNEVEIP